MKFKMKKIKLKEMSKKSIALLLALSMIPFDTMSSIIKAEDVSINNLQKNVLASEENEVL